ncbi:MAG: hypothetical protein ABW252_04345 [Polyangiales bacterium]
MVQIDPKVIEAKNRAEQALLKLPGVTGVDIGFKEVGGQPTDQVAIRVLVAQKRDVPAADRVPADIDGVPTDVIERVFELHHRAVREEDLRPHADTGTYTPLKGGISIGPCRAIGGFVYTGTLGAIVRDNRSGQRMLLSNFHVLCVDNTHAVGDTQAQPSRVDGGACPSGVVGTLARQALGGKVDCAVATVTGTRGTSCQIVDIGYVAGQATAVLGQTVRKRGRTTYLTHGRVDALHLTVSVDYGPGIGRVTLTDQIGIAPDTARNPKFGDHGDSGSVVVDGARKVIGLYFAGDGTGYGVANPIAAVLAALDVTLCTGVVKAKELKEFKELKNEKIELKELKREKIEIKEKLEFKEGKSEFEKPTPDKGPKELKEGGFEGPGFPGGPGDPGPIFQQDARADALTPKPFKELKAEKIEKLERKELKIEKAEHKELKNEKVEIKELKLEKVEKLEHKEIAKLEHGEKPGFKEKDGKELKESGYEGPGWPGGPGDPGPIVGRLAALEQAVASLGHFIAAGQRPDLTRGALTSEPDLVADSAALARQEADDKNDKDLKDAEKLRDC